MVPISIYWLFCFLWVLISSENSFQKFNLWISDLNTTTHLNAIGEYHEGKHYTKGFPIGFSGTMLFPLLTDVEMGSQERKTFWQKAKYPIFDSIADIQKAYRSFQKYVLDNICTNDDSSFWSCCDNDPEKRDCKVLPKSAVEAANILGDSRDRMPVLFLYHFCIQAWDYHNQDNRTEKESFLYLKNYCPDPCSAYPCATTVRGLNTEAPCEPYGPFEDQYRCTCQLNYVWDNGRKSCMPQNPCFRDHFRACVVSNTIRCIAKDADTTKCICKREYTGPDCSLPLNPCVERSNASLPSGNDNCRTGLGNLCIPKLGTDNYECICLSTYAPSLEVADDNCLSSTDPCLTQATSIPGTSTLKVEAPTITCLNGGKCVSSADRTRASCICPKRPDGSQIFQGLNCETPVGMWSGWSKYSDCMPQTCGEVRYRWRRRICLNSTDEADHTIWNLPYSSILHCHGTTEEVVPCPALHSCTQIEPLDGIKIDRKMSYYFFYQTIGLVVLSLILWLVYSKGGEPQ